ncbi:MULTISPECIES: CPBP family intramembrane glutamic endopeptidase [Pontibacillus]|uniref:CPBP family intramembrane metalloprotease n=1 Tax=Pontibacillus chungwhensis TaxID=265426 RepID=A0ABY8UV40_9BACI|nr:MULTISPECIES: CPBP family intramembrane glutamic endopeptidase [Pontibacillus]MCD5325288.1 CPBP family intramembrane metalloprotease [Pontibacillus sp. HN14]WIF97532.1 CPBP family intramembrane metalloprotease [Pontibacillus chungwhensis]
MNRAKIVVGTSFLVSLFLYIFEQGIGMPYPVKTAVKLLLFIGVPFLFYAYFPKPHLKKKKEQWKSPLLFGIVAFVVLLCSYWLTKDLIDFTEIRSYLKRDLGITPTTFYAVGFYIILGNSWIEEWFFRGFIFQNLLSLGKRRIGYVYSSGLFALYHLASIQGWFSLPLTLVALAGLFGIGMFFSFLTEKAGTYKGSWIVHMIADLAIILIGLHAFGWY